MATIRLAGLVDIPMIEAIAQEAYEPYVARIGRPPAPLVEDYARPVERGELHVAEDARGVCGFLVVVLGKSALLDNVAVATRARGQGVGKMLIERAEAMAREVGHGSIELYTNEAMTENLALYPRLGYRETHRATEKGLNRVYFSKPLAPSASGSKRS